MKTAKSGLIRKHREPVLELAEADIIAGLFFGGVMLLFRGYARWVIRPVVGGDVVLMDSIVHQLRRKGLVDCISPECEASKMHCFAVPPNGEVVLTTNVYDGGWLNAASAVLQAQNASRYLTIATTS